MKSSSPRDFTETDLQIAAPMSDVIIVGGGVIGLSLAVELAQQGHSVRVFDKSNFVGEASWAGAGMIPPGNPHVATEGIDGLKALSASLWPDWSAQLRELTGIDNGFQVSGAIELSPVKQLRQLAQEFGAGGNRVDQLHAEELKSLEPAVADEFLAGLHLPELAQMRTPRHGKALIAACHALGVKLHAHEAVTGFDSDQQNVNRIHTDRNSYSADKICVTAGPWSQRILRQLQIPLDVFPVRGQIVLLRTNKLPIKRVLLQGPRYVVPRSDGRVLLGSTEEDAGFSKTTTARTTSELIEFGRRLVPALANAEVERTWAGLRPGSPRGIPFLGRIPGWDNLFVATGHFRDGLLLSTGTARLMRQVLLQETTDLSLIPFAVPV